MLCPNRLATGCALLATLAISLPSACGPFVPVSPPPTTTTAPSGPTVGPAGSPVPSESPAGLARWSKVTPTGPAPSPRTSQSWTVDPSAAVAYLFAGRGMDGDLDDLWAYDLTADVWQRLDPGGDRPSTRHEHAAAWIDGLGLVVFGGRSDAGALDDFWAYDPAADRWRTLAVTGPPPEARAGACFAMRADGRLWLYGGLGPDQAVLADTWIYDSGLSDWVSRPSVGEAPAGRSGAACWWSADDRFLIHGGTSATGAALADAWSLEAAGPADSVWQPVVDPGLSPRAQAAVTTGGGGAVIVGGRGADGAARSDLVTFEARTLAVTHLDAEPEGPAARSGASLVDDPEAERLVLFGGAGASGPLNDLWALDLP